MLTQHYFPPLVTQLPPLSHSPSFISPAQPSHSLLISQSKKKKVKIKGFLLSSPPDLRVF